MREFGINQKHPEPKIHKKVNLHKTKKKKNHLEILLTNICSELCTGWKPTKDICIDKMVPTQYSVLYAI